MISLGFFFSLTAKVWDIVFFPTKTFIRAAEKSALTELAYPKVNFDLNGFISLHTKCELCRDCEKIIAQNPS